MRSPLTVRVADGVRDQHVTRFVKGLRFTKTAPGGHHSASVQIDAPEGLFSDLGPADRLFIYDGRNARTVWDGYVENPGRTSRAGGAAFDISAMGGVALAADRAQAVGFVDRDLSSAHWIAAPGSSSDSQTGADRTDMQASSPGIQVRYEPGSTESSWRAGRRSRTFADLGQPLHSIRAEVVAGKDDPAFTALLETYGGSSPFFSKQVGVNFSTTPTTLSLTIPLTDPEFGTSMFGVVTSRANGAVVDTSAWAWFSNIVARAALKDVRGAYVVAGDSSAVLASEVVAHLIGSGMLAVDPSATQITATGYLIQHLVYLDGVKPQQILDDLTLYEPDHLWEVLESGPLGGHRFAYRPWPTAPRYEISGRDFTESGGEADLCNRIVVSWTDASGAQQTVIRTASVPELRSRTKDAEPISLPAGQGSQSNAEHIGDQVLAALNTPSRSGSAIVREPLFDRLSNRVVMPWEIEPGHIVRVRDIGADLRLTEMTYDDANCSSSLTLGSPTLSLAQRIARVGR